MIKVTEIQEKNVIEMRNMKPMQIGMIMSGRCQGALVMRTVKNEGRREVIKINARPDCWTWDPTIEPGPPIKVRLFPPRTKVVLEVTE